jgi:hypothetical protein
VTQASCFSFLALQAAEAELKAIGGQIAELEVAKRQAVQVYFFFRLCHYTTLVQIMGILLCFFPGGRL